MIPILDSIIMCLLSTVAGACLCGALLSGRLAAEWAKIQRAWVNVIGENDRQIAEHQKWLAKVEAYEKHLDKVTKDYERILHNVQSKYRGVEDQVSERAQ